MAKPKDGVEAGELRRRAEERLRAQPATTPGTELKTDPRRLLQELQVYAEELEMQNEALRQTREALEVSLEQYTVLYDFAPAGYFELDGASSIRQANLAGGTLLGMERGRLIGRRFMDFVLAADRERFAACCQQAVEHEGKALCEVTLAPLGAPVRVTRLQIRVVGPEPVFQLAAMDVTEHIRAEESLRVTLESIGDGFFACDGDWRFVYVNAAAERILGIRREAVLGRSHWEVFPLTLGTNLEREYRRAAAGEARDFENYYAPWKRWFHNRCFPREGGGMSVYFQDITQRKEAVEALRASETRYRRVAEENARLLRQSRADNETKALLLHEVNHRVKNNLASIIGLLQIELRHQATGRHAPYITLVQDLTSRIQSLALVHHLLSASQWAPLPLDQLARDVMAIAPALLSRQGVVQVEIVHSSVHVTSKQANAVGLILNELATNSIKYGLCPDKTVGLHFLATQSGDEVCLEYRDTGPGYPDEILQGKRERVGLYLVEALAEQDLGGKVTLNNDQGAVTRLTFAAQSDDADQVPPAEGEQAL